MSFDQRRWTVAPFCSSLREQTLKFLLTGFYFKNNCSVSNHGMCRWWQLLQAPWHTWTQSWSAVVKVMTLKSPFKQWEFSFSGEQGILFFPKKSTVHQFISVPTPYPIKSSILLWIRFLSQFYPHIQQWNKNTCRRKYKLILTPNANMVDHSVGARDELHESEASEASVFCFDNLPKKNLASWMV